MEAAMNAKGTNSGPRPPVGYARGIGRSAYIDVSYETPVNNPNQYQQQQPQQQQMYNNQWTGYPQQAPPRANTMGSGVSNRHHTRKSSISSTSSNTVNVFMKKQWNRFNRSSANNGSTKAGGSHKDDDDDKDIEWNDDQNVDVSFDDLQHLKGDRFGGISGTTPYIPTILTKGDLNGEGLSNEQYRKLQIASKKKRAMDLANINKVDPTNRAMSLNTYGQQQKQQQPNGPYQYRQDGFPSQPQFGYPPQGTGVQQGNRGYGYPPQNGPGPRAMSLQPRGPPITNRAMSLQQQQQQQPYFNGPPVGYAPNRMLYPQQQPNMMYGRPIPPSQTYNQMVKSQQSLVSQESMNTTGQQPLPQNIETFQHSKEVPSVQKRKVQKIDFNDVSDSPPREPTPPIQDVEDPNRQSMVSTVSTDFQTNTENQKKLYNQNNDTTATGNTIFYSATEFNSPSKHSTTSDINTSHATTNTIDGVDTSSKTIEVITNMTPIVEQNSQAATPIVPQVATIGTPASYMSQPTTITDENDDIDFNRFSREQPLNFSVSSGKSSLPELNEDRIFESKSNQVPTKELPLLPNISKNTESTSLPLDIGSSSIVQFPITPASQKSNISFTPEQYGKVNDNDVLLKELELVTSELASSVSRELTLEDTIRNKIKTPQTSPTKTSILEDPEAFLKDVGVTVSKGGDVTIGKELTSSERGQVILTLANLLAKERQKRYTSEEILLHYETENGLSKEHDNYIKELKGTNQELQTENTRLKDLMELEATKKELLEIEKETLTLEVADITRKYTRLQKEVIPRLETQVSNLEDLILKRDSK